MKLSILIPSIPSRFEKMITLFNRINNQIKDKSEVEILVWIDNKNRSIGRKRNDLVTMSQGKYIAFVDDDDGIADSYIEDMLTGCDSDADVITFKQLARINDVWTYIDFSLENENEEIQPNSITRRKPFHVCGIKRSLTKNIKFANVGYGEDWDWMQRVLLNIKTEYKIDKVLHFYSYKKEVSEAPIESNKVWKNLDLDYEKGSN